MGNIVLGVSGSISAYRACDLARDLMRLGHTVRVCLTDSAQRFVTPILFETLTGQPCLVDTFDEPERGRMAHLDWARQADLVLIAPATANVINQVANGIASDMLTTLILASECPLVIAPAMNPAMLAHPETTASIAGLAAHGVAIIEPQEGDVVAGEHGKGKLATNQTILAVCTAILCRSRKLQGQKVLITSGPTREPIDDVRFISNRSSGKMGVAVARAAQLMGAEVSVISGPIALPPLRNTDWVNVQTAEQMLAAAREHAAGAAWIVGLAAVADYRPATATSGKVRRSDEHLRLELVPNPDIIATLAREFPGAKTVAFAAEPGPDPAYAREKMVRKGVAALAINDITAPGIGFESDENELTLIWPDGQQSRSGRRSKLACGLWLLEELTARA